jgi:hypothetical protein
MYPPPGVFSAVGEDILSPYVTDPSSSVFVLTTLPGVI